MMAESNANKYNAFKNVSKDISWMGSSKFFNPALEETWVIQFSPKGSQRLAAEPDQKLIELSLRCLESVTNDKIKVKDSSVFRWKYAQCGRSTQDQMFTKIAHNIFAIGDWHISSRVESAFLSGKTLAEFLSNKRP
jgi:predicted NAD/FAD-dependent oxidoreductase